MGIANKTGADDNSGLYDLKELATSAKKRRSQRLSSEVDAQQSLLQSSAALEAVALPDPKKSQEIAIPVMALDSTSSATTTKGKHASASAAEAMSFTELPSAPSSSRGWLLAGTAVIAIAGAAAFVLLKGKVDSPAATSASQVAAAINAPESEVPTPVQALPLLENEAVENEAVAVDDEVADDSLDPDLDQAEAVQVAALEDSEVADEAPREAKSTKGSDETAKRSAGSEDRSESKQGQATEADDKPTKAEAKAEARAAAKSADAESKTAETKTEDLGSNASVDDILSSVTGGVDTEQVVVEDKGPSKKRLERGDFAKAMKAVSPQAKACFAAEEFSGMVTVKYSVEPDGSVSGAESTGAHKSSKTGACVAKAVRNAKFPAFNGAPMSSSFPFLLSP